MFKQSMQLKQNEAGDNNGASGTTPPASPGENPPANPAPAQAGGDQFDQFGYKTAPDVKPGEAGAAEVIPPVEEKLEDIKDPATGYGSNPPADVTTEKVVPPVVPPVAEVVPPKLDEIDVKGLADADAAKIKELATTHKLPKEAAQALVDMKKSEAKAAVDAQAAQVEADKAFRIKQKKDWDSSLRSDPHFGNNVKEQFDKSLLKVEKVLKDFMPGTRKLLTEQGLTLNPGIMKDLAGLAKHLYNPEKMVSGEGIDTPVVSDKEEKNDPLAFYT